jgi:hypothetical protein
VSGREEGIVSIFEQVEKMTERDALKAMLKVVLGEYPPDDDRYTLAWTVALKFGIDPAELE